MRKIGKTELANADTPKRLALVARGIGIVITIICVVFVGSELFEDGEMLAAGFRSRTVLLAVLVGCVLWVGLNALLGMGWMALARMLGVGVSPRQAISISFVSQVAKYLPGNVFHLAGRVWVARQLGLPTKQSSLATAGESIALVAIALLIGASVLISLPYGIVGIWGLAGMGGLVVWVVVCYRGAILERIGIGSDKVDCSVRWISILVLSYVGVFLIQYAMFVLISMSTNVGFGFGVFEGIQVVVISWLAGFVVVGSPGGIGVREATFAFFANGEEMRSNLMLVAALMRLSSIMGDCVCFTIGQRIRRGLVE